MNIVHLFDQAIDSRSLIQVAIGLRDHPDIEASFSDDLYCLGKQEVSKAEDIEKAIGDADLIFRPNDAHFHRPDLDQLIATHWAKIIYYDIKDDTAIDVNRLHQVYAYLKRSWTPDMDTITPLPYGTLPQYYIESNSKRELDVVYLFPDGLGPTEQNRAKVLGVLSKEKWPNEMARIIGLVTHTGLNGRRLIFEEGHSGNKFIDYLHILKRAKIVVTCSPDHPGGDSRLWEALASGACVMTDRPRNLPDCPLEDKKHVVFYDFDNLKQLPAQIKVLLHSVELRERIAGQGYKYAKWHHRPVARIEQVLKRL